jgi:DNA-binding CsgD family transcriptional regulator
MHMDRLEAAVQAGGAVEQARLAQAKAEMARARGRGSGRDFAKAADAWESIGRPYKVAQARWRQAECEIAAGKRDAAAQAAAAALAGAERLGSNWLADEVRALIGRARLDAAGAPAVGQANGNGAGRDPQHAAAPEDPFGLTPRERQVLQLVAKGATNRQIGQALYMAEKTASVHVSRILSKLDVQGRTEAAAVAHRLHLT